MILKVKASKQLEAWHYYDNISEVHSYTDTRVKVSSGEVSEDTVEEWFEDTSAIDEYAIISFLDHEDRPRHVYTNIAAYLMTDTGKTIERLI